VQFGTPTKCLGEAIYDIPGLTHQGTLAQFWQNPGTVDRELYARFRYYLRTTNQLNGSVWTDLFDES
jgi:capsule polysaccharide modification protein KpsS